MSFYEGSARVPLMIARPAWRRAASTTRSRPSTSARRSATSPASRWRRSCPGPTAKASCRWPRRRATARWRWNTPPRLLRAAGRAALGQVEIHQLRARSRAVVRSRGRSARADQPRRRPGLRRHAGTGLRAEAAGAGISTAFDAEVRESQARRWVVYDALRNGGYYPWDFQPLQKASERYMRNHKRISMPW
jgi:choline-sulfatase